ncbi:hypothetical protein RIF29_23640 [Crotalaria pallida]|uniref:Protein DETOXIFICATION n=1 Tax=Crotalaria pallida TaxID=3830 RepID=A0AAN9F7V4_CROPI
MNYPHLYKPSVPPNFFRHQVADQVMETPLLVTRVLESECDDDYTRVKSFNEAKLVVWTETVKLWEIAVPVALTSLSQYLLISSTAIFAGHLGDLELSSISVCNSVLGTISFALLIGMSTAMGTICGQAYGAGQIQSLGIYLQRSWIVLLTTCIILLPIYIYATPFLKLLGQDNDIAELAGYYSILSIPTMFSNAINLSTQRFLQFQNKVSVIMFIAFATLLIHNALLYLFIYVFSWGITGAAMAFNISSWVNAVAQVVYAIGWCKEAWTGLSWLAFSDLWGFARLCLASSVMICFEQWYTPCVMLLVGHLHNPVIAVGSYSICQNFFDWQRMLLLGINVSVSVRVSNTLGMRHPRAAMYSFLVAMLYSILIGLVLMTIIFLSKDNLAMIFTNSKDMQLAVTDLAYLLGLTMVINSAAQVMSGFAIGIGWQVMVAYINLACYFIVGLALAILLGFAANLGVKGLWGGTMCGSILQILCLLLVIWKTNWTKEVIYRV